MASVADFYRLTKPGIVYGNGLHYVAGVLLAATLRWDAVSAIGGLVGVVFVIASACVVNNYLDRTFDAHMQRTQKRPSVTGAISLGSGILLASMLGVAGFATLILTTNWLTVWLGVAAYVLYAFVYTLSKRYTVHHTIIGTIPGALPAVAGYVALTGELDAFAWGLFGLIVAWQLPHFYAISVYRKQEYASAGVPQLASRYTAETMRWIILSTLLLYSMAAVWLAVTGLMAASALLLVGGAVWWAWRAYGSRRHALQLWARRVFFDSLVLSLILSISMAVHTVSTRLLL